MGPSCQRVDEVERVGWAGSGAGGASWAGGCPAGLETAQLGWFPFFFCSFYFSFSVLCFIFCF